ncbi:hypothetical protein EH221_01005 [bacterium]|nr:MAG: hypothetical protein EH221_01005 [bacterium]
MALVHEQLYATNDFANIPFQAYVKNLVNTLVGNYNMTSRISCDLNIADIALALDAAIPCGLIINEMLTNSLKYAFPDHRKGKINISMRLKHDNFYELIFQDDGIGLSGHTEVKDTESFGMKLISMLVQQIKGQMELSGEEGTRHTITFQKDWK